MIGSSGVENFDVKRYGSVSGVFFSSNSRHKSTQGDKMKMSAYYLVKFFNLLSFGICYSVFRL